MKEKYLFTITFVLIFAHLVSCQNKTTQQTPLFPEQVQTSVTDRHLRLKGTHILCMMPSDYTYYKHIGYYQKGEGQYIKVMDSGLSDFVQAKPYMTKENLEKLDGRSVSYFSDIMLNGYSAFYTESINQDLTQLDLYFGDSTFIVTITAVCKANDIEAKNELMNIMQSIHYDKTSEVDPLEPFNIWFDTSITGFKHTATTYSVSMYAENGADDAHNAYSNSLHFRFLSEKNEGEIYDYLYWLRKDLERSFKIKNKEITKTEINGLTAYVLETEIYKEGKFGIFYQVVLVNKSDILLFSGTAYDKMDDYLIKYKKTVESIVFK